jgi:hypothetical protein
VGAENLCDALVFLEYAEAVASLDANSVEIDYVIRLSTAKLWSPLVAN